MRKLFYPESVVVFGVADSETNWARTIVKNLENLGFKGSIYAVGREGDILNGRKILSGPDAIEGNPDLAVFLIPAHSIPDAMEACGKKGIRYAVVESSGFNEYEGEGSQSKQKIMEASRKWGIRFVGPNCIGIINMENGLATPFVPLDVANMKKGSVSIASQSGGVIWDALHLFSWEDIGFNKLISMGNKLDLNENDYLEYLSSDPGTSTIALYLENITDGRRLMSLARETDKPVIVLKANIGSSSHQIAQFHTAALAGDDEVADMALRQAGLHRVQSMQEMVDCIKIFSLPLLRGPNLAIFGRSGGYAVLLADAVHHYGFKLAKLSDAFFDMVRKETKSGVIRLTNPLDLGDVVNIDFYIKLVEKVLQEKTVDGLVFGQMNVMKGDIESTRRLICAAKEISIQYGKPVVFRMMSREKRFLSLSPIFVDSDHSLKALSKSLNHFKELQNRKKYKGSELIKPVRGSKNSMKIRNFGEVFDLLRAYRLPVVDYQVVKDLKEALEAAKKIGYPVALKTASMDILHKTEFGGVRLNLFGPDDLKKGFRKMDFAVKKIRKANTGPFIIQKMAPSGREVIIGGRHDPEFGPVILFGLGGTFVELLKDVSMRVAPINERIAREMIRETKGFSLLKGFRGESPADILFLTKFLVRASRLLVDYPEIKNLDINPFIVLEKGQGGLIIDAKMEIIS